MTATAITGLIGVSGQLECPARLIAAARGEDLEECVLRALGDGIDEVFA
ncbi:hypothetical protein [Herbiconiux solani]|nr:hypothetical protein [Herbiconiux solani]